MSSVMDRAGETALLHFFCRKQMLNQAVAANCVDLCRACVSKEILKAEHVPSLIQHVQCTSRYLRVSDEEFTAMHIPSAQSQPSSYNTVWLMWPVQHNVWGLHLFGTSSLSPDACTCVTWSVDLFAAVVGAVHSQRRAVAISDID